MRREVGFREGRPEAARLGRVSPIIRHEPMAEAAALSRNGLVADGAFPLAPSLG